MIMTWCSIHSQVQCPTTLPRTPPFFTCGRDGSNGHSSVPEKIGAEIFPVYGPDGESKLYMIGIICLLIFIVNYFKMKSKLTKNGLCFWGWFKKVRLIQLLCHQYWVAQWGMANIYYSWNLIWFKDWWSYILQYINYWW